MPDIQRRPKPSHSGRNGFDLSSDAPDPPVAHARRHRFASYILSEKGHYFPDTQAMKDAVQAPDTLAAVQDRIAELTRDHDDDLARLYSHQARDYLDDALDRYLSRDDSLSLDPDESDRAQIESYAALDKLYKTRKEAAWESEWSDAVARLNHAHLSTILPLHQQRAALEKEQEERRRYLDAQFPASIEEYHALRSKDTQLRVARFLLSDTQKKESMLSEFGWAWRQVQPLSDEYHQTTEFKTEIQEMVKEVEVRDPRRK